LERSTDSGARSRHHDHAVYYRGTIQCLPNAIDRDPGDSVCHDQERARFTDYGRSIGFIALLGILCVAGMMITSSVVLLDQINAASLSQFQGRVEAAVERLSPVANAAATTVIGMTPVLGAVFWFAMAVTSMCGLAFGTLLTMLLAPVLYATFYRARTPVKN